MSGFIINVYFLNLLKQFYGLIPFAIGPGSVPVVEKPESFDQDRIALVIVEVQNFMDADRFGLAFDDHKVDLPGTISRLDGFMGELTD